MIFIPLKDRIHVHNAPWSGRVAQEVFEWIEEQHFKPGYLCRVDLDHSKPPGKKAAVVFSSNDDAELALFKLKWG
jgi:hypothetical protein